MFTDFDFINRPERTYEPLYQYCKLEHLDYRHTAFLVESDRENSRSCAPGDMDVRTPAGNCRKGFAMGKNAMQE